MAQLPSGVTEVSGRIHEYGSSTRRGIRWVYTHITLDTGNGEYIRIEKPVIDDDALNDEICANKQVSIYLKKRVISSGFNLILALKSDNGIFMTRTASIIQIVLYVVGGTIFFPLFAFMMAMIFGGLWHGIGLALGMSTDLQIYTGLGGLYLFIMLFPIFHMMHRAKVAELRDYISNTHEADFRGLYSPSPDGIKVTTM